METGGERLPSENKYYRTSMPQLSDSNRRVSCSNNDRPDLRLYQAWKGSNVFCLGGRFIFGPDVKSLFFTVSLIVTPVAIFCAFVAPRLVNEFPHHLGHLIVAISAVLTAYVVLLLFLTSARDPGIIPRNPHPPEDDGSTLSADWPGSMGAGPTLPPTKDVMVNGVVIKVKYCQTCMLYRPPRCSHCSICNNCVEHFDHHCPWVGQCIGKRNYRFFSMFVSSTTMLCLYVFAFCWVNIRKIMDFNQCNLWTAFLRSPISGILILYTFVSAWFVGGLTAFHLYLIFTNQTTYENFRYHYNRKTNPFNHGCTHNAVDIFFSKIPKSKNNFRGKVKADSFSVCSTTMPLGHALNPWMSKSNFDVEVEKRQAVVGKDFEDIQSQIENVGGLDGCGAQPRHTNLDHKANEEVTTDMRILATELEMEHGSTYRQTENFWR